MRIFVYLGPMYDIRIDSDICYLKLPSAYTINICTYLRLPGLAEAVPLAEELAAEAFEIRSTLFSLLLL